MRIFILILVPAILALSTTLARAQLNSDIRQFIEINKPLAENGSMKWSQYYSTLSAVASRSSPTPHPEFMRSADEIAMYAGYYEDGKITREDFDAARNQIINKLRRTLSPPEPVRAAPARPSTTGADIANAIMQGAGAYLDARNQADMIRQQQYEDSVRRQQMYQQQQQYNAGYNCTIYGNQANCVPANPYTPGMIPSK